MLCLMLVALSLRFERVFRTGRGFRGLKVMKAGRWGRLARLGGEGVCICGGGMCE
jgi:hypothetical protein